jgi:7-cyano-7-deazaguanine synthase
VFTAAASVLAQLGTAGHGDVRVEAPFADMTKDAIVSVGAQLGVPIRLSWSCYKCGDLHCGTCGTCTERREAFELADVPDPTAYAIAAAGT